MEAVMASDASGAGSSSFLNRIHLCHRKLPNVTGVLGAFPVTSDGESPRRALDAVTVEIHREILQLPLQVMSVAE